MLWNVIYQFFVTLIFGGNYNGTNYASIVTTIDTYGAYHRENTAVITLNLFKYFNGDNVLMPLGNYLSLIATIITLVVILVACFYIIKQMFMLCARLFA